MNFRFCGFLRGNLKKKKIGGVTFAVGDACPLELKKKGACYDKSI